MFLIKTSRTSPKKALFLIALLGAILAKPDRVGAVVINELNWAGSSSSSADEWLELYNPSQSAVELSGWMIEQAASSKRNLVLPEGSSVGPGGYFLIANFKPDSIKTLLAIQADWVTSSLSLGNSDRKYQLINQFGQVIDSLDDGQGEPWAGLNGRIIRSMERVDPKTSGAESSNWRSALNVLNFKEQTGHFGTPGAKNSALQVWPKLVISEVYAKPADSTQEYIELYNHTGETVSLDGWLIDDAPDGSRAYQLPNHDLQPNQYLSLTRTLTGLALNDTGDSVRLIAPDGQVVDQTDFPSLKTGFVWALIDRVWRISQTPTPGQANILTIVPECSSGPDSCLAVSAVIGQLESLIGQRVRLIGFVSRRFSSGFYFKDETGEVRVSFLASLGIVKQSLQVGDKISVEGLVELTDTGLRVVPDFDQAVQVIESVRQNQSSDSGQSQKSTDQDQLNQETLNQSSQTRLNQSDLRDLEPRVLVSLLETHDQSDRQLINRLAIGLDLPRPIDLDQALFLAKADRTFGLIGSLNPSLIILTSTFLLGLVIVLTPPLSNYD